MNFSNSTLSSLFHAYDIRALDSDFPPDFFFLLGYSFCKFLNAKSIVVGRDFRRTSYTYQKEFIDGALAYGTNVEDIGEIATEMLYFATGSNTNYDGGAVITASHNPSGWNGCKLCSKGADAISETSGLKEIATILNNLDLNSIKNSKAEGTLKVRNIWPEFRLKILSFLEGVELKPLKICVDAGNGIGGKVFDYIFSDLPITIEKMYFELDDRFPNHEADPMKFENVQELIQKVNSNKYDLGIALDGDSDRAFFVTKDGKNPTGAYTGAVLAKELLKKNKGCKIVHDPRVIWPIAKEVLKAGGVPIVSKAGHSFFKEVMSKEEALFGAEMSSHFFYRDFYNADSGMLTCALIIRYISEGLDFNAEINQLYSTYHISGEHNYTVENPDDIINKLEIEYSNGDVEHIDGLSVSFQDWRFNLRKSNTQPLIRLNVEAVTEELVAAKLKELEDKLLRTKV